MAEVEPRGTEHPARLATADLASTVDDEEVVLRATLALEHFKTRERWRGFTFFALFFVLYLAYTHVMIDWRYGGETNAILDDVTSGFQQASEDIYCDTETRRSAVNNATCWWDYNDLTSVSEILQFVLYQLSVFGSNLIEVCEGCRVSMTPKMGNVEHLGLIDYACADFSSSQDTGEYPDRDCAIEDAAWSENPNVVGAPCCQNATLMVASFLMLALRDVQGRTEAPLSELIATLSSEEGKDVLLSFLQTHITEVQHIFQIIISRDRRMLGIHFTATRLHGHWVNSDVVRASNTIWSKRFDILAELWLLRLLYLFFSALSVAHDFITIWCSTVSRRQLVEVALHPWPYFVLFTVVCVWIVEVGQSRWGMVHWTMLVAACQMLLLCRLFVEGEVLTPFRLIFRTVVIATKQLSILIIALLVWMAVMAGIYGMLFGTFNYTDFGYAAAFLDIFGQFGNGPSIDSTADAFNYLASRITFVITMLTLYLTLSQVFITILMDSYEQSREDIAKQAPIDMPADFEAMPFSRNRWESMSSLAVASLTYYLPYHKAFTPQIIRFLNIWRLDAMSASPGLDYIRPFATQAELEDSQQKYRLNKTALDRLLCKFGARKIRQETGEQQVGANFSTMSSKNSIVTLRARVFALGRAVGDEMPYRDLAKMDRQSLLLMLDSLYNDQAAVLRNLQKQDSSLGVSL